MYIGDKKEELDNSSNKFYPIFQMITKEKDIKILLIAGYMD